MKAQSKIILILAFVLSLSLSLQAQERKLERFDVEKHHQEQTDFFAKEMELTADEKKAFAPLMQDYIHARFDINKNLRKAAKELKDNDKRSEADYQKVIDMAVEARIKEAQLQKEFFAKIGKILPAQKVIRYTRTEKKFMGGAVRQHKRERGDK